MFVIGRTQFQLEAKNVNFSIPRTHMGRNSVLVISIFEEIFFGHGFMLLTCICRVAVRARLQPLYIISGTGR